MSRGRTLSYRRPEDPVVRRWVGRLLLQDLKFAGWEASKGIIGVLLTLLPVWFLMRFWEGLVVNYRISTPIVGPLAFAIAFIVVVPLLFWWERRTQGRYLEIAANENRGLFTGRPSSYGEWELRRHAAGWMFYMELFLTGPRLIMDAAGRFRRWGRLELRDRESAAWVMGELLKYDQGIPVTHLDEQGLASERLRSAVAYLCFHDLADISKDGSRVWTASFARK
jgi:hypothetical protein